jgi:uncharacterized protein (TIGR00251 family)
MPHKFKLSNGKKGAALAIRVTPRASRDEIVEVLSDQTIKIRLTAPPVEDKANTALIAFLSEVLGVPKANIEIVAGQSGRDKLVSILDIESEEVHKKILLNLT